METARKRTSIQITWNPSREAYQVRFDADEEGFPKVVRALKKIDLERRSYNSVTRCWSIHPSELDTLRSIAVTFFDDAQLVEGDVTVNLHTGRIAQQLTLFA